MRPLILTVIVALALASTPAPAEMCTLDTVPAATLLLPHFEVDLDAAPGEGVNTVFTLHNALPTPALAWVTIWTDWSQPTLGFNIFLTGYDVQTVDLYDALVNGNLPVTADEQSDLSTSPNAAARAADPTSLCDGTDDSCSPHGTHPQWDGTFDGSGVPANAAFNCIDFFPFFVNPLLSSTRRATLRAKHTGQPENGACFGADHGDSIARGYITIDNVNACSLTFPHEPGFFSDGVDPGIASSVNQLWGDWALVDPSNLMTLPIDPLVHVEADPGFDATSTATGYTFYGRYTQGDGGLDHREPLASAWGFKYVNTAPEAVTDLVVWRDSTASNQDFDVGFPCGSGPGTGPDWHPLEQTQVFCFDPAESVVEICADTGCFPLESQRLELGSGDLEVPYAAGWCQLNLNIPGDAVTGDVDFPPPTGNVAQSWVGATVRGAGVVAGGLNAVALGHACEDADASVQLEIFADGFESGDTTAWPMTMP